MNRLSKAVAQSGKMLYGRDGFAQRALVFARLSVILNAALALGKIAMGLYSPSFFLCLNGLYNLGIGGAKLAALKGYRESRKEPDDAHSEGYGEEEYRYYYLVGIILLIASIIYMLYCIRMLTGGRSSIQYTIIMGIAIAAVTFTEIGLAIHGIIATRRSRSPVMEALKLTNLAASMISLVLTQTAIMSAVAEGDHTFYFGVTGILFGGLAALTGLHMIVRMYLVLHGKSHRGIIARATRIARKHIPETLPGSIRYEDHGPRARRLHIHYGFDVAPLERIKAEIERKLQLDVIWHGKQEEGHD